MTTPKQPKPGIPSLRMPEGLQSKYSNMARISHTPSEIVFDFATMLPGVHPEVVSRVLMSPVAAKMFLQALTENIKRYEATFGPIKLPVGASDLASTLFRNVQPPSPDDKPDKNSTESPPGDEPPDDDKPPSSEDGEPPSTPEPPEGGKPPESDNPPESDKPPEGAV
jgi:hypothetical protein